ncbi:hypothetical protein KBZ20_16045 [Vulcanococcus limneticus Candia 3F8]|uniref:hypothetical protein n=1 Tax=Vulcanococcus limneticus TaxID=2170428 RepID=UPI000B98C53B|nr:hypothetical protein [Vulcanococcus limneticus]MCP9793260.1 hypothetical protein [Vulcanococcus limneticus MW73D5]MCP9895280.1 hypothetical protein [Vulcanococcus limneticus Candia 3F8]MCP9898670.1 hypothetical protein [Vulcanococcus limneticus Candia 3B3]
MAIMVPFFGVVNTSQSQYLQGQLQEMKQESERKQRFASSIQSQLENLTGRNPVKAKLALASLYALAKDETDKAILFTVAISSGSQELRDEMADLVLEDVAASPEFKEQIRLKLGRMLAIAVEGSSLDPVGALPAKEMGTEQRMLERLTRDQGVLTGWIDLGALATGSGAPLEARGTAVPVPPVRGSEVTLTRSVDLWESAPNGQRPGRMTGRVAQGSRVAIEDIRRRPRAGSTDAVWAKITVRG